MAWSDALKKRVLMLLFFLYLIILVKLTIFRFSPGQLAELLEGWGPEVIRQGLSTANLWPGKSIRMYIRYFPRLNGVENLFGNVLALLPFGLLLPALSETGRSLKSVLGRGLALALGIELTQLIFGLGAFDVDDILLNMLGIALGGLAYFALLAFSVKSG